MGSACSNCAGDSVDKTELITDPPMLDTERAITKNKAITQSKSKVFANNKMQTLIQNNIKSIILLQAFIRRLIAKKQVRGKVQQRDMYRMHARYFQREELFETLSREKLGGERVATYKYRNGAIYEGQWLGGFRNKNGTMTWADGASYNGEWDMGYASGQGVFIDCLGNKYEGQFRLSMANGTGNYTNTLGAVYQGEWRDDMQHGFGIEKWTDNKSNFEGQFREGLRNGQGIWVTESSRYEGNWVDNMMEGQGIMEWTETHNPNSSFKADADKAVSYNGAWKANKRDGFGVLVQTSQTYIGFFKQDFKFGCGKLIYKKGAEFIGCFDNDEREGYGYYKWPDNKRFKGWWHKSKQHGLGMYLTPEEQNWKFGLWQMGRRIKWLSDSECELIRNGSTSYTQLFESTEQQSKQQAVQQFSQLEQDRLKELKFRSELPNSVIGVGFHCPIWVDKQIDLINN